jgi:hypothetical protein
VLAASIISLMMEAASTSETSANFYQTARHYNPKDSHLHARRHGKLKSLESNLEGNSSPAREGLGWQVIPRISYSGGRPLFQTVVSFSFPVRNNLNLLI